MESTRWTDDDLVGVWSALLRLHAALVPAIDADLQRAVGMPIGWYDVLLELNSAPCRRMRMAELGEAALLSRTRVSRLVDELESKGYVRRVANPEDRRSSFAELTEAGRAEFRRAAPAYLASIRQRVGGRITERDAKTLRRLLESALR